MDRRIAARNELIRIITERLVREALAAKADDRAIVPATRLIEPTPKAPRARPDLRQV